MDLLPLYYDGVCNENSRKAVEEHLTECDKCKNVLEKTGNNTIDNFLKKEREEVVAHHAKAVKRKSLIVGISIASVMAIPVLITLIVNLATGHALDWFFIVLTSLMTLASLTVVPLIFEKEKRLWTLGSFTASLTLLLLSCSVYDAYTGGDGLWFFVAIVPVFFGLSVLFAPFVIKRLHALGILTGFAARHKGLLAMSVDTILLYAVIAVIGLFAQNKTIVMQEAERAVVVYGQNGLGLDYWRPALLITSLSLLFPWGLFLIIRYLKANSFIRAGICVIFSGLFLTMIENMINWILEGVLRFQFRNANLLVWNSNSVIDANIWLLIFLSGCVIGGVLLGVGLLRKKKS